MNNGLSCCHRVIQRDTTATMMRHIRGSSAYAILMTVLCLYMALQIFTVKLSQVKPLSETSDLNEASSWKNDTSQNEILLPPGRLVTSVSCQRLFEGDKEEQKLAMNYTQEHPLSVPTDKEMLLLARNCSDLKGLGYRQNPETSEEAAYPIAFSMLLHKDVFQAEQLLRMVYHPQNYYCIHVDKKANSDVIEAMKAIASCFPNVNMASKAEDIVYAGFTRLQAEINCMADMLNAGQKWKYYINLVSSVLPLRTNREMVQILKLFNGANDIEGIIGKRLITSRFSHVFKTEGGSLKRTDVEKTAPPHGIKIVRGSAYGTFSRGFVDFIINDQRAKDLLEWSKDTYSPDEHYWATLHHLGENPSLNTPGGYKGKADEKPWLSTYASWGWPCFSGNSRHGVCIFGIRDLPQLINRKELFANKFDIGVQYLAAACIEELLQNRTMNGLPMHDWFYYSQLPYIQKAT